VVRVNPFDERDQLHSPNLLRVIDPFECAREAGLRYDRLVSSEKIVVRRLGPGDVPLLRSLNALFGEAFGERETYGGDPPSEGYLADLLARDHVIVMVALESATVVGGLVAYELEKFERMRREIYIYDLAVDVTYRRRHIATNMIASLRRLAAERGAWVIYVQADYGDDPAIALYQSLGTREEVLHFDIAPSGH
jgi:aminoglycoside 3-N-acetyltransferase I